MLLCSFISNEMKGGTCQIYAAGLFNTKSYFKRHKAEMGFCFPACQSPGIHSTGRCPTRPKETVGEHCAGQLANATVLCTTVTFLAFGSFFFVHFWDIVNVLYCFLQKRKKNKLIIESKCGAFWVYFLTALTAASTVCHEDVWFIPSPESHDKFSTLCV